ncbi:MAG: hypothetical protein KGI41_03935 [Patescibacteria group bacterium]|nr:hypothetical protein [Patescibacteria group bacterium]MDE1966360.1 hypothetical protein [Patescibacteria group bacterium]
MQPVQPFAGPALSFALPSVAVISGYVLLAVLFLWVLYTLINFYHWFRYSRHSIVIIPAIVAHLFVSSFLLILAGAGALLH